MTMFKGKLAGVAAGALCLLLLVGAGYAMGLKRINPFRSTASAAPDSIALALSLNKRCGKMNGQTKIDCSSKPLDSLASAGEVRAAMGTLNRLEVIDVDAKRDGHVYSHGIGIAAGK